MPKKLTYTKGARRFVRRFKRKAVKGALATFPRNNATLGIGFPKKLCITHKYAEQISLTSTSGVLTSHQFSCNSMYDPNAAVGGHQPMAFDQLSALYNHYTVIGSRFRCRIIPATATTTPVSVACYIADDNTVATAITQVWESSDAKRSGYKLTSVGQSTPVVLNMKWSAKKRFGKAVLANYLLQGSLGASPSEQQYFTIVSQSTDGTTTTQVYLQVEIEYIAVWKELKDLVQS